MKLSNLIALLLSLMLVACGGSQAIKENNPNAPAGANTTKAQTPPKAVKSGGGYYLDDGPGDNPPADLNSIPDAIPRNEPLTANANRPYKALGTNYTPMTGYQPYKKSGLASWYGKRYHGKKTSTGEIYDMYSMTAAHTTLPIPSYARVSNPANGKSVIVRINDRGPFHNDRIVDLSYAAAYKLGILANGSGIVDVEAIDTRPDTLAKTQTTLAIEPSIKPTSTTQAAPIPTSESTTLAMDDHASATASGVFIQVGAFKLKENADNLSAKIRAQNLVENSPINNWYNEGTHRVRIGPYASRQDAERNAARVKEALRMNTYIIVQP